MITEEDAIAQLRKAVDGFGYPLRSHVRVLLDAHDRWKAAAEEGFAKALAMMEERDAVSPCTCRRSRRP